MWSLCELALMVERACSLVCSADVASVGEGGRWGGGVLIGQTERARWVFADTASWKVT